MDLLVLGPVEVRHDGAPIDLGGARQRAVLARLAMAHGETVPVDRLIDDLWNGSPPPSAMGVLQAYVSNLRRLLEPERLPRTPARVLLTRAPGYALAALSDADRFDQHLRRGIEQLTAGDAARAISHLDDGLRLWRGGAYEDLSDEDWAKPEVARLDELRVVTREHRCAAMLGLGQAHEVTPELEALVTEHPLREGLWRLLALALYRAGRQADALGVLRRYQEHLLDELGLDPGPSLQQLQRSILEHDPALGAEVVLGVASSASGQGRTSATPRPPATSEAPVTGRSGPMALLRAAADMAAGGAPSTVLVSGEAGIGKSWLVGALADELAGEGWRVTWGRCHDTSGAPALWPWLQVLGDLDGDEPLPSELEAFRAGAEANDSVDTDAADARFRQHAAIRRYLMAASKRCPLMIVLEDLQWADVASVQLLADVQTLATTGRLLMVATARPDQGATDHASAQVRLDRAGARRLKLTGLDTEALQAMAATAGHVVSGSVLRDRTGGNPFFARETLRLIEQVGVERALSRVPETVGDLVRQRLASLPPEAQTVLQVAGVFGRDVDIDAVAAVSGQTDDEVWDAVDAAVITGVLSETADGGLRFTHDLLRETVYADLAPLRRSRLHARVVDVLQRRPSLDVFRLAEHAHAAGPVARAAATRWSVAAAEQAQRLLAHEDAVRWWHRAVDSQALDSDTEPKYRLELLLSLLQAQLDAGDAVGARETRNQAVRASDALSDSDATLRALVALDAPALWLLKQFDEVELDMVGRLERALAELEPADSERRCRVLATLAMELYDGVIDPRCDELSAMAVAMARRVGSPPLMAFALNARYLAVNRMGVPDELTPIGHQLIAIGAANALPRVSVLGHALISSACFYQSDLAAADLHAVETDRINRRLDLQLPRMQSVAYRIARLQLDGRFAESAAALEEFSALRLSWWAMDALLAVMRLCQWFLADELDQATPEMIALAKAARPSAGFDFELMTTPGTTRAEIDLPDWPQPALDWGWLAMMAIRAEAVSRFGTDRARRSVYDQLLPHAGRIAYGGGFAMPVDWGLGRIATALSDYPAAVRHLAALESACIRESLDWWARRARNAQLAIS